MSVHLRKGPIISTTGISFKGIIGHLFKRFLSALQNTGSLDGAPPLTLDDLLKETSGELLRFYSNAVKSSQA